MNHNYRSMCFWSKKVAYRIISNISTVLYFFNVPRPMLLMATFLYWRLFHYFFNLISEVGAPRAIARLTMITCTCTCNVLTYTTVWCPLLGVRRPGWFSDHFTVSTSQCAYNGDWALYFLNAAPRCSIIGDVLLLETVLIIRDNTYGMRIWSGKLKKFAMKADHHWICWGRPWLMAKNPFLYNAARLCMYAISLKRMWLMFFKIFVFSFCMQVEGVGTVFCAHNFPNFETLPHRKALFYLRYISI